MSKEDIKRAQAGNPHRNEPDTRPFYRCPFPNCGRTFQQIPDVPDVCTYHRQFILDYAFVVRHLTVQPTEPEPVDADKGTKLYIPNPGQAKAAIKQALDFAKGGKKP